MQQGNARKSYSGKLLSKRIIGAGSWDQNI